MLNQTFKITALAAFVGLTLTACGSSNKDDNTKNTQPNTQTQLTQQSSDKAKADAAAKAKADAEAAAKEKAEKEEAAKKAKESAEAAKKAEQDAKLAREQLEKNAHHDGNWRIILSNTAQAGYLIDGNNTSVIKDIYVPYSIHNMDRGYYYKNEEGGTSYGNRIVNDIDLSKTEINPNKVQKLSATDNLDAYRMDVYVVNQKYSSYASWDNGPNHKAFPDSTKYELGGAQVTAKYASIGNYSIYPSSNRAESAYDKPAQIVVDGGSATYKGKILAGDLYFYGSREDLKLNDSNMPTDHQLGELTLNADFKKQSVSGTITSFDTKKMDNAILHSAEIEDRYDGLQFSGKITSDSKVLPTANDFRDYDDQGTYQGTFIGPNAEEVVGQGHYVNYDDTLHTGDSYYKQKAQVNFVFGATREGEYSLPATK
ncbi:transferrin-binding protein-like solute binding protein [Lonepinella sp. BR2474]|uniref:transferrin-binding protein-like solute binding protein n=1 Tax=Lonepinella sp. BR2474 TaxID=3434548 RepID=UPI003F6E2C5B